MEINFNLSVLGDIEVYEADITLGDGVSVVLTSDSDETTYDEFRADTFQDILEILFDESGDYLEVTENFSDIEDVAFPFAADLEGLDIVDEDYLFWLGDTDGFDPDRPCDC